MSQQDSKVPSTLSRRDFLKLMGAAGTALTFAPFVPWGQFMPNPDAAKLEKVPVILPDGSQANISTFPVNHAEVITYPQTGDRVLDEEAFRKWQFIRLPPELGGSANNVSSFRVYSMVCLHLWCLWKYWPQEGRKRGECPCHGSMYSPTTGVAFAGPASLQAAPSNALPKLDLEADSSGDLWILPARFVPNENGVVGYGRFVR
jgi:rieske iron-sulfur protein